MENSDSEKKTESVAREECSGSICTEITFYILENGDVISSAQNEDTQSIIDKLRGTGGNGNAD